MGRVRSVGKTDLTKPANCQKDRLVFKEEFGECQSDIGRFSLLESFFEGIRRIRAVRPQRPPTSTRLRLVSYITGLLPPASG